MNRKRFLQNSFAWLALGTMPTALASFPASAARKGDNGFFKVAQVNGHWWFITPAGKKFFSVGLNHIDSSALRYEKNLHIWRDKYQCDEIKWIKESVAPSLGNWGFNTIGWTQEVVTKNNEINRHSMRWSPQQYQAANMPYCHLLPFSEVHQWEVETRYPDVFSPAFAEWCDFVARENCVSMAGDPLLIGYFFSDCPSWLHPSYNPALKGPWFDPERYKTEAGRQEFGRMVDTYYRVITTAIRRYDKNHLILGDRLEAKQPLPDDIIRIAAKYVDVLSFQYFAEAEKSLPDFKRWHELSNKPILLADASVGRKPGSLEEYRKSGSDYQGLGDKYVHMMEQLYQAPFMVGWHFCGAFIENEVRKFGLYDPFEKPTGIVEKLAMENKSILERMKKLNKEG